MANADALAMIDELERVPRAWTWRQLEAHWSRSAINGALRRDGITRVLPGIYAATLHCESFLVRAHAAHLWCGPTSVLIGPGAAAAWELCNVPREVDVATAYGVSRGCPPWLTLHRHAAPIPHALWGQCPVATPAWAAVTAYAQSSPRNRDGYIYRAVQSGKARPDDLRTVAKQLPRVRGRAHLFQVIAAIEEGAESHLEMVGLRRVFNTRDFADFVRQHWVRTAGGNYRLDMFHPASRTAVELDGTGTHGKPDSRQYDITRDVNVAAEGILTLRLSSHDIESRARWCRDRVLSVVNSRM